MTTSRLTTEALNNPAKVPPMTWVRCFSASQRPAWLGRAVDDATAARASVGEALEDDVALGRDEEVVEVGVCVAEAPAVDVWNWNAPRNLVLIWGAVALLQQLL
jgi:hypothetical protein